jgi:hypothetical protein
VPITTNVVSSNPAHGEVYSIQHYVIKFVIKKFEDTKEAIRIRISKKNRQHNGQKKKNKRTNNDQQNMHIKLRLSNTNPTKYLGWTLVLRKGKQLLLH